MVDELMTAAVLTAFGGPDVLQIRHDVPVPRVQPNHVLVRVTATSVNNTDIWTREGAYGLPGQPQAKAGWRGPVDFPRIQGTDIVGRICEVGPDVDPQRLGERVLIDPTLYDGVNDETRPIGYLGSEADGGFAEYTLVAAERAHTVTDSPLSDEQLACLPTAYGTALGMLERAAIHGGETVLVTGASGGVGLALVQLAVARGANVIAVTTAAKADQVRSAGASRIVDRESADFQAKISSAAPEGLDAVADVVGGDSMTTVLPLLNEGGRWVIAGAIAGSVISLDLRRLYLHNLRLIGSSMHTPSHFRQLVDEANAGRIHPSVVATYPLNEIHEAQRVFERRQHIGKIVVTPSTS